MTRQTWTALVSALVFVLLAVALVVIPVPFVTWGPGSTRDTLGAVDGKPIIEVQGIATHPTSGRLDLTVVSVTPAGARLSLPQALLAYWLPHRDALPLDSVYAPGKSAAEVQAEDADMMSTAQDDAVVAALRSDGQPVTALPAIFSVTVGGPAHTKLLPGDLVLAVDGVPTEDQDAVSRQIRAHKPGESVTFTVVRQRREQEVAVPTVVSTTQEGVPVVGITLGTGYRYDPRISFELGQRIGGPSAGLVFALAIYDKITAGELLAGRHVAGTGSITPDGEVGGIGGIQEKIAGAEDAGASVFLVPASNCDDLAGVRTDMTLVRVATLRDAIGALETLQQPDGAARVPRC
ncbi:PDZ domain-containing protein [Friedmanniella luteola]|uniref:endopeptidase La n=1 Tax=Friedmanniella luteola TaxID=546871 RepID=A0A1H1VKJ4_9ACTN|nr:PDZ domain-containing protein [Friedmanniella luteola]SDS84559.1 PDZ domain-containing protein [Friedmanniella luteola]